MIISFTFWIQVANRLLIGGSDNWYETDSREESNIRSSRQSEERFFLVRTSFSAKVKALHISLGVLQTARLSNSTDNSGTAADCRTNFNFPIVFTGRHCH